MLLNRLKTMLFGMCQFYPLGCGNISIGAFAVSYASRKENVI